MIRIAIGGILHETNTFAPGMTERADFEAPAGWPPATSGAALIEDLPRYNVPSAGALRALTEAGAEAVPTLWAMALPSGTVRDAAFADLLDDLLTRLSVAGPVDGVFLDLHGAMATASDDDPEGTVLAEVRRLVGPDVPIAAALDPHANMTARMAESADFLAAYRTYPHTDLVETGTRAMQQLLAMQRSGTRPAKAYRAVPFSLPLIAQATTSAPMDRLIAATVQPGDDNLVTACFGFPLADVPEAGPALVAYAPTPQAAEALADSHLDLWRAAEGDFVVEMMSAADGVRRAMAEPAGRGPVVLADVQDNPGAGGSNDTTGLLTELVAAGAEGALMVHIADKPAVAAAHDAGLGAVLDIAIGGRTDPTTGDPVPGPWRVTALGDGHFTGEGPMYRGNDIRMGPVALLEQRGTSVIVAERRMQASEPGLLRHLGLDPATRPILALKSSVHFRGAYGAMARAIYHVAAPGLAPVDISQLPYRKANRPPAGLKPTNLPPNKEIPNGDT